MAKPTVKEVLFNPVFANNPIGLQILGICSALAVTSNLKTALVRTTQSSAATAMVHRRLPVNRTRARRSREGFWVFMDAFSGDGADDGAKG